MGSLTSGPSAPSSQPQIVYVQQPVSTSTPVVEQTTSGATAEETSEEIRSQNLLDRERSRFGTVQTSFRGLLGIADQGSVENRKTLLGE